MKRWIFILLLVFFSATLLINAWFLGSYLLESNKQQQTFNELANLVEQAQQNTPTPPTPTTPQDPTGTGPTVPQEPTVPMTLVTNAQTGEEMWVLAEYAQLYTMNSDIVGWMKIDGTVLNYPVMQTPSKLNYYLHRDFYKEDSKHGCLYAREACDINAPSDNITIYGHKMQDGTMFAPLLDYKEKDFWTEHPVITFDTLTEHHTYEIFSVFLTSASPGYGFSYHLFVDAADEAEFDAYVAKCKELSLYDTGISAEYGDKLITLSTCEYSQYNGRLVVVAKRID